MLSSFPVYGSLVWFSCVLLRMAASSTASEEKEKQGGGKFECNICFDQAKDAVVSMCGHLFW